MGFQGGGFSGRPREMHTATCAVEEDLWDFKVVVLAVVRVRCIRQPVRIAKKSARFLLSRAATVRFIARIAFQSVRTAAARE